LNQFCEIKRLNNFDCRIEKKAAFYDAKKAASFALRAKWGM